MMFGPDKIGTVGYEASRFSGKDTGIEMVRRAFRTKSLHFIEEIGGTRWFQAVGKQ